MLVLKGSSRSFQLSRPLCSSVCGQWRDTSKRGTSNIRTMQGEAERTPEAQGQSEIKLNSTHNNKIRKHRRSTKTGKPKQNGVWPCPARLMQLWSSSSCALRPPSCTSCLRLELRDERYVPRSSRESKKLEVWIGLELDEPWFSCGEWEIRSDLESTRSNHQLEGS